MIGQFVLMGLFTLYFICWNLSEQQQGLFGQFVLMGLLPCISYAGTLVSSNKDCLVNLY